MKKRRRILQRSILSLFLSLCMVISPLANVGLVVSAASETLYSQDFSEVTDASTVAYSKNAQSSLTIATDDAHGSYLNYDTGSANNRGAYMDFTGLDVTAKDTYIVEFDAALTAGNQKDSYFTVKGADFAYSSDNIDWGPASGYLLNMVVAGNGTEYTLNGTEKVTIPKGEWCHYKLYVDKTQGLVSTTITGSATGTIADKVITAYDGEGNVAGLYMLAGRYYPVQSVDNVVVRTVDEGDEFGQAAAEILAGAEFTEQLNVIISQSAEGETVSTPVSVKANGNLGGDLTESATVEWSMVGAETEATNGNIYLTQDESNGAATTLNVKAGVSNCYGYVQAVVAYGENSYTIKTPFAVIGDASADENQLAPVAGYPVNMNDYADTLVGYEGTSNGLDTKDVVLNSWSIYGSNASRTMKLVKDEDGTKSIEFASNGGSGSTVAVYQWADQAGKYVIDFTAKFTAAMSFGVYANTPNNSNSNPEWSASYADGALTLNGSTDSITGINANEWYRFVVTADASTQKAAIVVYDSTDTKVGELADVDMTNADSVQKYFCFMGTWPMYLNSFEAYVVAEEPDVAVTGITLDKTEATVKVGETATLTATVAPENATDKTVTWTTSDEKVATVANGVVTAVAEGTATITATTANGLTAACTVTVEKAAEDDDKDDEVVIEPVSTAYYVIAAATGDTTTVDTSALSTSDKITGYKVTTAKDGKLVKQEVVKELPTSVDTKDADWVEIAPVFFYDIGVAGEKGEAGYTLSIPAGTYDFVVYNTSGQRCDVYVNDQMLVNNILQNGSTPNYFAVNDIVVTEDNAKISTADYSGGKNANSVYIKVEAVKSPSIVDRAQKVYVLGDSLVCMYYNGGNAENNYRTGWGQVLADYLVDEVEVVDLANSGAYASVLYGTAFSQVLGSAQKGDILVLESGYNDRNYSNETEMKTSVTSMVTEAEALGVEVILVSPNASAHDYKESVAWTSYMADVAASTGATYVDLSKLSYTFMRGLYVDNTDAVYVNYNLPNEGNDSLHSSYNGANKWASLVAQSLYEQGYEAIIDADYVYTFVDTLGNVISCSATGKVAEGYAKVTYEMNGHGSANSYLIVEDGVLLEKPNDPVASGFAFGGWFKDAECTTEWNFETDKVSGDTIIYAKWIENSSGTWYSEDFTDVTDASTVMTSPNAQGQVVILNDETLGNYLAYDFSSTSSNSRGAYMNFTGLDVSNQSAYIVEFDAALTPGNNQTSYFAVKGADFKYISNNVNYGAGSGYLLNLVVAGGKTEYTMNTTQTVTIPSGEWCHYKLYVDKTQGLVSTTITGSTTGTIADKVITSYDGEGNVAGLYMLAGRYNPVQAVDNILVRGIGDADEFGEIPKEILASAEFSSALNTVITQPAEGEAVHMPITVKGNGSMGNDMTDQVTVEWSVVGLENEDGYISLTKAEGTGAGTEGEAPDGTTAYFNVRNGVSNYYGYVQAVVTCEENSYTIRTPFAVIGASAANDSQLAPAAGYPVNMNDYVDSLVGYLGTSNGINTKDIILNNWSIYGSNGARTMELVKDEDGTKSIKFASNGGGGSTVAVYQWADQTEQYVIDMTVKFTADMAFGVYFNTPNNEGSNPEWTASFGSGALTLGTESVSGLKTNEWYRIVVSADASIQKASVAVYDSTGALLGKVEDADMANDTSVQKYFCFAGTWPVYLNSFKAYKPVLGTMVVGSESDVVKVPENGEAAATVDFSAVLTSTEGIKMTGAVEWSLADEYANVEIASTGAQTATLTISEGASGTVTVVATKDGKVAEKEIQLTTSGNVVAFTESTSSITIPFAGEEAFVKNFVAVTRSGDGKEIEGGTITYSLLAKDGVTETTVKGVTFENGKLTVEAGANPAVVYVRATNGDGLSTKVKVNIHGLSFAFGSSDAAEGYTQVTDTQYTEKLGYGFANTTGLTVNESDVTGTAAFRFKANVPNGNYTVKVDTTAASMTSEVVESVPAATGITKSGTTFSVAVVDGVLDLTFPAAATVTTLEISQAAAKTALEKPMLYSIGDSTTKNDAKGGLSWGNCVETGLVTVPEVFSGYSNHGMAGRDSVDYYNEGRVEAVLLAICPGDYVTVNMGINSAETGEAASYYTLMSEYYVEGILQRGGIPVILTATPDGPVVDEKGSLAKNYDATTGKFTNNRGNGARNDVLRQIASEKNVKLIELGQWGEDWMNTLTMDDVTAYNTAKGTEFKTVLEMVQSWYVDHNHYKEYLGVQIANYLFTRLENTVNGTDVVEVTGVTLDQTAVTVVIGETATLKATVKPGDATDKTLTWTTSDEKVATVADGVVTAVAEGTATITVTTANGKSATATVTVKKATVDAESVALDKTEATIKVGETVTLTATVAPEDTTDKTVAWSSSDEKIATVADGVVTAVAAGSATITVTTVNGKTATCTVTVEEVVKLVITDIDESHWGYTFVTAIAEQKIMNGVHTNEDGSIEFAPNDELTREMVAQILYNAEGTPEVTAENEFTDVVEGTWYEKAVIWAAENGIVSGYPDGTFGVGKNITRQEIATMLCNYATYKEYDTTATGDLSTYADVAAVEGWATDKMSWAVGNGIITGKAGNLLDPKGNATRAEAATMIYKFKNAFESAE